VKTLLNNNGGLEDLNSYISDGDGFATCDFGPLACFDLAVSINMAVFDQKLCLSASINKV